MIVDLYVCNFLMLRIMTVIIGAPRSQKMSTFVCEYLRPKMYKTGLITTLSGLV